jgi:hypothetical protein
MSILFRHAEFKGHHCWSPGQPGRFLPMVLTVLHMLGVVAVLPSAGMAERVARAMTALTARL